MTVERSIWSINAFIGFEMTLRQARILSSETDNTIKQEQTTNVNIKVNQPKPTTEQPGYPSITPAASGYIPPVGCAAPNFTSAPVMDPSIYQSVQPTVRSTPLEESQVAEGEKDAVINELTTKLEFMETLLMIFQSNPLRINSYIIADNRLFMKMIKVLSGAEKVELVLDDDLSCHCGCTGGSDKLIYVSKILVTINGRTEDLKYCRNDVYSQFTKYCISTKIVSQ